MKKKRVLIIAIWLIFLLFSSFAMDAYVHLIYRNKALTELRAQANVVAGEIPDIILSDANAQLDVAMMRQARLNSLCLALEGVQSLPKAKQIARNLYEVADVKGFAFYDTDGNLLGKVGRFGEDGDDGIGEYIAAYAEYADEMSDSEFMDELTENMEFYQQYIMSSDAIYEEEDTYFDMKKCGQWYVAVEYNLSQEESDALEYFSWQSALSRIKMCDSGFIMVLDENDGTILCYQDEFMVGHPMEELGIRFKSEDKQATIEDLNNTLTSYEKQVKTYVGGKLYYALRMNVKGTMMIALLPANEVRGEAFGGLSAWVFLLFVVTGIMMVFAIFYMEEGDEDDFVKRGKFVYQKNLSGRLRVGAVLSLVAVLVMGSFLQMLTKNAELIHYNEQKVYDIKSVMQEQEYYNKRLSTMYQEDELIRARIASVILRDMKEENVTPAFMEKLADSLEVKYCTFYNATGKLKYSNSPYAVAMDSTSEYYTLLKGREEIVGEYAYDENASEYRQKAGVSVIDKAGKCIGAVVVEKDADRLGLMLSNLNYDTIWREVNLTDFTQILILSKDDLKVKYYTYILDGKADRALENSDYTADSFSIDASRVRDKYKGNFSFLNYNYYASIIAVSDDYLIVFKDMTSSGIYGFLQILIVMILAFLYAMLLLPLACFRKAKTEDGREKKEKELEPIRVSGIEAAEEASKGASRGAVLSVLSTMTDKNKPYFEERWAKDSTKWKDKNASQKFTTAFALICFAAVVSCFLQAIFMRETSVWFYSITGEWDKGLNVHSIVFCTITIVSLFFAKIVIHKLLYLTARASNARGETICHLLDSFLVFIMYILGFLLCLANFGFDLKTLTVTSGVTYLIISFSCQNILADMMAGILMTLEGVVQVGDYIMYEEKPYIVYSIGIRTTRLKWYGEVLSVRNNDFKNHISYPAGNSDLAIVRIGLDYQESIERFEAIFAKEQAYLHNRLNKLAGEEVGGPVYRGVEELADNSIVVSFAVYCKGESKFRVKRLLNNELLYMCERENIILALPQVVVHEPEEKRVYNKEEFEKEDETD